MRQETKNPNETAHSRSLLPIRQEMRWMEQLSAVIPLGT